MMKYTVFLLLLVAGYVSFAIRLPHQKKIL
jgi:hypothetical protein